MMMVGDLTLSGEHTMKYMYDILLNCTHETYIILLNDVTPNKFNFKNNKNKLFQNSHGGRVGTIELISS